MTDRFSDLERLQRLREQGAIDEAEFAREKATLMGRAETRPIAYRALPLLGVVIAAVTVAAVAAIGWALWPRGQAPVVTLTSTASASAASTPQPMLSAGERLAAAVTAVFPRGAAAEGKDGEHYTFTTNRLIDAPFGPVLVSAGQVKDAAHVTGGRIDIAYLRPDGGGFGVAHAYPAAVEIGSFGQMSEWSISDKLADVPTIDAEGGFTGQGYSCAAAVLTELRPEGPAEVASIPTLYDNSGAMVDDTPVVSIAGKIANVVKGASFDVLYTGTKNFTEHWMRAGGKYVRQGATQLPEC